MELDAETIFDGLGKRYEDAFANYPDLREVTQHVIEQLGPNSRVLDIGCGTGKPVSQMLAEAGHNVHGIDVSKEMVNIASSQVPQGTFEKVDMRKYDPEPPFDAVFTVLALYQISLSDTHSMMFKIAEWLRPGGMLVVGVTTSEHVVTSIGVRRSPYEEAWAGVQVKQKWWNKNVKEVFFTRSMWGHLLEAAGLSVETERNATFHANDPEYQGIETHSFIVARKTKVHSLLGPYPLPELHCPGLLIPFAKASWQPLADRLRSEAATKLLETIKSNKHVLEIVDELGTFSIAPERKDGSIHSAKASSVCDSSLKNTTSEPNGDIPFPSYNFDAVVATWALGSVDDQEKFLKEVVRVTDISSPDSRIVILQGAPDNEITRYLNSIPAPATGNGDIGKAITSPIAHQGSLLNTAMQTLPEGGFGNVSVHRVHGHVEFPESDPLERRTVAANLVAGLRGSLNGIGCDYEQTMETLAHSFERHFEDSPHAVGFEMAMLVAKRTLN
ncbi:hypothetical protein FQN54_007661 [Arachnomyces sp. PD_36]|nr:hypothetical protein FQN54_007661 [Arachnomyces sp. PD_36]